MVNKPGDENFKFVDDSLCDDGVDIPWEDYSKHTDQAKSSTCYTDDLALEIVDCDLDDGCEATSGAAGSGSR